MTRCYLVRHAQTIWNGENRLQGHSDLPLSPLGEWQARCLARWFASQPLQRIFTSTLQRSRQTAQMIAVGNGHQPTPIIDEGLAEMHLLSFATTMEQRASVVAKLHAGMLRHDAWDSRARCQDPLLRPVERPEERTPQLFSNRCAPRSSCGGNIP